MIRHYLRVIWNRKRANLLITLEIFFSFLVVFAIVAMAVYYLNNYRRPLGFTVNDVWVVSIDSKLRELPGTKTDTSSIVQIAEQLHREVAGLAEIRAQANTFAVPYGNSRWIDATKVDGRSISYNVSGVTDGFAEVLGLELVQGRWFGRDDDADSWVPVVLNEQLAREAFGDASPLGKTFPQDAPHSGEPAPKEMRVVGVIREYRQGGDLGVPESYMLRRARLDDPESVMELGQLVVKVAPGTTAAFEETLVKRMQAIAKGWSFEVRPLDEMRDARIRETLTPLVAAGIIAAFLTLMVALGLTGVVWQTVTQRTREIGLRRAKGATIPDIRAQILGELTVMSSIALLLGTMILIQLPMLGIIAKVGAGVYAASLVISALCIYLLTLACAYYPSRMATRVSPAEALHYE